MPPLLHDPAVRDSIRARIQRLRPDTPRKWGTMTPDQMLHHVNRGLENALDDFRPAPMKTPLPRSILKLLVFNLPWPRGAPTVPEYVAGERYSFENEHASLLTLLDRITARDPDGGGWGHSGGFGALSGREWSRLSAKHIEHHLRQFGL